MKGRITGLGVVLLVLFAVVIGQAAFVQVRRASALDNDPRNPRVEEAARLYPRGDILAANGTVLAKSIRTASSYYEWRRVYPLGSLFSATVGFSSTDYGNWGLEAQYNAQLISHAQPAHSVAQVLSPNRSSDTLVTTLSVPLQQVAARALAGQAGAVVAIDPRNGAVLALYSNPTYNPGPMTSLSVAVQKAYWHKITQGFVDGFHPLTTLALQDTFPPGSTFKVVTTAAILRYDPALATYSWGPSNQLALSPWGSNQVLFNAGGGSCGGTIQMMLPESCDPGYAYLGIQLGAHRLSNEAKQFGFDAVPPLDLPAGEVTDGFFPPVSAYNEALPQLGYSAIGQWDVRSTALQDALVAAGIADGGRIMVPHLMKELLGADGTVISTFKPRVWRTPLGKDESATVNQLMQGVVQFGTALGIFLPQDQVAAKTGTAQTGDAVDNTDDWMIAFAPATHPIVAVAVVLPFQPKSAWGATVAGPVMRCVIEGALAQAANQPVANTPTTCPA